MIVADKFVFVHVPKTGGTWLRMLLHNHAPASWNIRSKQPMHRPLCAELPEVRRVGDTHVYYFVRNPWDWYVSQWQYWKGHYDARTGGYARSPEQWTYNECYWAELVKRCDNFTEALPTMLAERSLSFAIESQCAVVPGMVVGHAYRFEALRSNLLAMLEHAQLDVPEDLRAAVNHKPPLNISQHAHYSTYYRDVTRAAVYERERRVIDRFGYVFNEPDSRPDRVINPADIFCYMHTCPQRKGFRSRTIDSIAASDVDPERFVTICHQPGLSKAEILQWWETELLLLCDVAEQQGCHWLLRFEDDILVNKYILDNVSRWPALREADFGMGQLFLWNLLAADQPALARSPATGSLYRNKYECPGSQCQLIRTNVLRSIVPRYAAMRARYWADAHGFAMDGAPSAAVWHMGKKVYIHEPSLVDCHDRGLQSAQGNVPKAELVADSFDEMWRR